MHNPANQDPNAQNDRKLQRHEFLLPIAVIDTLTGDSLGALVNINIEGLMVMGNVAIDGNRLYQVELQLPDTIHGHDKVALGIDCLWSRRDEEYERHWAGFQIIDVSQDALKVIEHLIRDYSETALDGEPE